MSGLKIQESGENYLETILILEQKLGAVRSVDVAAELGFSKPSISRAMSILKEAGLIEVQRGALKLTETGRARAEAVYERHRVITRYLTDSLGLDSDTAEADACRIEHIISEQCFEKIKEVEERLSDRE